MGRPVISVLSMPRPEGHRATADDRGEPADVMCFRQSSALLPRPRTTIPQYLRTIAARYLRGSCGRAFNSRPLSSRSATAFSILAAAGKSWSIRLCRPVQVNSGGYSSRDSACLEARTRLCISAAFVAIRNSQVLTSIRQEIAASDVIRTRSTPAWPSASAALPHRRYAKRYILSLYRSNNRAKPSASPMRAHWTNLKSGAAPILFTSARFSVTAGQMTQQGSERVSEGTGRNKTLPYYAGP